MVAGVAQLAIPAVIEAGPCELNPEDMDESGFA